MWIMGNYCHWAVLIVGVQLLGVFATPTIDDRLKCKPGDVAPATRVDTTARLMKLREKLTDQNLHAYIVPMDDEHQNEYVSSRNKRVEYISGFSGSAGMAIITRTAAALWTDGRYFLQGDDELDCNWLFMKEGQSGVPSKTDWLISVLNANTSVATDGSCLSYDTWKSYSDYLAVSNIKMVESSNLVDEIWAMDNDNIRPPLVYTPILVIDMKYSGKSWQDKVEEVMNGLPQDVGAAVITALDETAWLFNVRGEEISFNPVFQSYAIINKELMSNTLYMPFHTARLYNQTDLRQHWNTNYAGTCDNANTCVTVKDYSQFFVDLAGINVNGKKVWVSPMSSYKVSTTVGDERIHLEPTLVRTLKGQKNPTEVQGMRNSHKRDSAAVIDFIAMLEEEVKSGKEWTEISASDKLEEYRRADDLSRGLSFETISAVGSNGAIIHYKPQQETNKKITTTEMYLLDSGGQYMDGTTDVTRTFHFGSPTDMEKEAYTRVLLGSIDLAMAKWPKGIYGRDIDILARNPLWQAGLDYRHGTGHGIGAFLNVHEGPGRINYGYRESRYESILYSNMFFSDEPGYYEDGKFGVRLETIVMTKDIDTKHNFGGNQWMGFEEFTLVPFEPHLIDFSLFNKNQLDWLNNYHARCQQEIGEELLKPQGKTRAYNWLKSRTATIQSSSMKVWKSSALLIVLCFFSQMLF